MKQSLQQLQWILVKPNKSAQKFAPNLKKQQNTVYSRVQSPQTFIHKSNKNIYKWDLPKSLIRNSNSAKNITKSQGNQGIVQLSTVSKSGNKDKNKLIEQIQKNLPTMKTSNIIRTSHIIPSNQSQSLLIKYGKIIKTQHFQPITNMKKYSVNEKQILKTQKSQYENDDNHQQQNSPIFQKQKLLKSQKKKRVQQKINENQVSSFQNSHYNNQKYIKKDNYIKKVNISNENKQLKQQEEDIYADLKKSLEKPPKYSSKIQQRIKCEIQNNNIKQRVNTEPKNDSNLKQQEKIIKFQVLADHQKQIQIQKQYAQIQINSISRKLIQKYNQLIKQPFPQISIYPIRVPKIPSPPHHNQTVQQYMQSIRQLCQSLKIQIQQLGLIIKRYHNCIYFKSQKDNKVVIWNFDGRLYVGGWKQYGNGESKKSGEGIQFGNDYFYDGDFHEGKRHGKGRLQYQNGNYYEGDWKDGKMHGEGVFFDKHNFTFYDGKWENGKQQGKGKIKYSKKHFYNGNFSRHQKSGKGIQYFQNGSIYIGNYQKNQIDGHGTLYYQNKQIYLGNCKNLQKHGKGLLIKIQKQVKQTPTQYYYGQFVNNLKSGYGIQKNKDGTCYLGYFYNNFPQGPGIVQKLKQQQDKNDNDNINVRISGVWKNGKLVTRSKSIQSISSVKSVFKQV